MACQFLKLIFPISSLFFQPLHAEEKELPVQVYFSPQDMLDQRLIALIEKEEVSIQAAIYCLMDPGIAKALNQAQERGVKIELVIDPFSIKKTSPIDKMAEKGIPVYVWNQTPSKKGSRKKASMKSLMHDKFCIFGNHTVWTGSFNFTQAAAMANCENALVLSDLKLVKMYQLEFEKIKTQGSISYQKFSKNRRENQKTKGL